MPPAVIGIDLGTTNCVVASVMDGKITLLEDKQGQVLFPSVVSIGQNDRIWTGSDAIALGATAPGRTAYAVKRLIGRWYTDEVVQRAVNNYAYDIKENPSGGGVLVKLGAQEYTPEQISALVLKGLLDQFEARHGTRPEEAVITVPAYFSHSQREGTQRAAAEAGLKVLRLLNEPTAAALSLPSTNEARLIAVYDFGGGTFDFSIIHIEGNVYEVKATDGDTFLGGDDIDGLICDELSKSFEEKTGVKLRNFPLSWYRLRDAAEKAKKELSHSEKCSVYLPRLVGSDSMITEISRERVEELAKPLLERSLAICDRTMEAAHMHISDINDVVLVGGQTRMPLLQAMVQKYFARPCASGVNPDTAVAEGAAKEAAMLRQGGGALLLDVTPITLGINIAGNRLYPLIPKNTKIPTRKEHRFTTHRDAQTKARMVILQGDHPVASENSRLGEIVLERLQGFERFHSRIDVAFEIDASGILHVKASDKDTGEEQDVVIRDSFNPEGAAPAGQLQDEESLSPSQQDLPPSITGPFRATELLDVLYFLHANKKTGKVELDGPAGPGELWMLDGEITHARKDDQIAVDALRLILLMGEGHYAFHEGETLNTPREIDAPFGQVFE